MNLNFWDTFRNSNSKLDRILFYIIGGLLTILLIGTVVGLIKGRPTTGVNLSDDPKPTEIESLNKKSGLQMAAYTGLGTIRTTTIADEEDASRSILVISPWFSYPEDDTEFYEELSRKRLLISGIITSYFSTKTKQELLNISEETIKADILKELNSQLSLGKIQELYFTDYIFIE